MWWTPIRFKTLNNEHSPALGKEKCAKMIRFGVFYTFLMALSVTALAPMMLILIVPESYHGAIQYIPYLCGLMALHFSTNILNIGCYAGNTTRAPMIIDMISAGIAFVGYVTLIPIFLSMGAIYATAIALLIRLVATVIVGQYVCPLPYRFTKLLPSLILPILFLFFAPIFKDAIFPMIIGSIFGIASISIAVLYKVIDIEPLLNRFQNIDVKKFKAPL